MIIAVTIFVIIILMCAMFYILFLLEDSRKVKRKKSFAEFYAQHEQNIGGTDGGH